MRAPARIALCAIVLACGCGRADAPARDTLRAAAAEYSPSQRREPAGSSASASDSSAAVADSAGDPAAVVRAYYAAIGARDFERAYALWGDGGRASGKAYADFARGFAETASVVATVDVPGRVEGAAGSRYVDVPVQISARQRDGSVQRFRGSYTLRRAVVDGATAAQRTWHLYTSHIQPIERP